MQDTPNTPGKSLHGLEVCTPIGTEAVRLEDGNVSGRWRKQLAVFGGWKTRLLVEDFVNWSDTPDEIVRFTEIYGPINSDAEEGKDFQFSVEQWRSSQQRFRMWWEARAGKTNLSTTLGGELPYQLNFHKGKLLFWATRLEGFLILELFTAPAERFRKCKRPGCENPYFVARHLKQAYCSAGCAAWAQAHWKKNWWGNKGSDWLASRKRKASRKPSKRRTKR